MTWKILVAAVATSTLIGWVLFDDGDRNGRQWQEHAGLALLTLSVSVAVCGGLVALWMWAI